MHFEASFINEAVIPKAAGLSQNECQSPAAACSFGLQENICKKLAFGEKWLDQMEFNNCLV